MSLQVFFPEQEFPEIFKDVMLYRLFADSKTFPDAIPKAATSLINKHYEKIDRNSKIEVDHFVREWFDLPQLTNDDFKVQTSIEDHINLLWSQLTRRDIQTDHPSSKILLPYRYVVPGGRFREIYYWDSYFTMLGLMESGHHHTVIEMIQNFSWLIDNIGHIPNGNRSYFLSRSQPPFFALMVELVRRSSFKPLKTADHFITASRSKSNFPLILFNATNYLPALLKEYDFWMDGLFNDKKIFRRIVKLNNGEFLNRYYDDMNSPRVESYAEDLELFSKSDAHNDNLFQDLRAACESGWDFSSRWMENSSKLNSIQTTQILPVDLNVLLYILETTIAGLYKDLREYKKMDQFNAYAINRASLINELFWNEKDGYYGDYHLGNRSYGIPTLAMVFPLFARIASNQQARQTSEYLEKHFLKPGGWVTTKNHTGQQWDAPNGWAPLQWITFVGLQNYGFTEIAKEGARRWLQLNENVFKRTGRMMEKYNVEDLSIEAGGGEYPVQDGFGWTNGVYLALKRELQQYE